MSPPRASRATPPIAAAEAAHGEEKGLDVRGAKLAALRSGGKAGAEVIAGIELTHPDRILFPEQGLTKRDLAVYYETVADRMLPHIARRPLVLLRCPEGRQKGCFFQRHFEESASQALRTFRIRERSGRNAPYGWLRDASGLVSLAQLGALEIHIWGARIDAIEKPDRIVFDLDPDPDLPWERVVRGAVRVRERLAGFGLKSFVKTTGGKGLHIVVPLLRRSGWEEVLAFSRAVALGIAREDPGSFTATASKARRKGKIYIDVLRNARGATSVAPYSPRARPGAPVSMPVGWEELGAVRRGQFAVADPQERLRARGGDPWAGFHETRQGITKRALSAAPAA